MSLFPSAIPANMGLKRVFDGNGTYLVNSYPNAKKVKYEKRFGGSALTTINKRRRRFPSRKTFYGKSRKYFRPGSAAELKYQDVIIDNTNTIGGVNTAPNCSAYILNPITQGSGAYQRIGKSLNMKQIMLRLKLRRTSSTNVTVRIILIYVKESDIDLAGNSGLDYILSAVPSTSGSKDRAVTSPLNLSNTSNFVVLKDTVQELDDGHGTEFYWQYFHRCNLNTEFTTSSTGCASTDYKHGSLWIVIADNNYGTNPSIHSLVSRVRFYDS